VIGIDTHDVVMAKGMVITVEPRCYFISRLLDGAFQNEKQKQLFNEEGCMTFVDLEASVWKTKL
jgi:hypothetical protein